MNVSRLGPDETPDSAEALRQSEERFRLMIEAVKDYAIFMLDPEGHIASWNEGARRIKGYQAEEIIGKHFSIFYPEDAIAEKWPEYELEAAVELGSFEDEGWRFRKDGGRFWANVVITPLFTPDGDLMGFTKVTRDLSERKRNEQELRRAKQQLEEAYQEVKSRNSELQDFAQIASHDLQEPLRKMATFADLLEGDYGNVLDETGRLYLARIRDSATRMSRLITDLLAYSRAATQERSFEPVDLNRVIDEVLSDLQVLLDETDGRVEKELLPTIEADSTQMRQLFQNLIGNSLKFHRPGVPPVVRISAEEPRSADEPDGREVVTITVEDNGIGFGEMYSDAIFDPFHRLHTSESYEGTGLGLAICKRIVERHGGTLKARAGSEDGAVFIITLPLLRGHNK